MSVIGAMGGPLGSVGLQPDKEIGPSRQGEGPFASPTKLTLLLGFLLVVATFALYYPVHTHPFVNYDDLGYVKDNVHVTAGLHWQTIKWSFTSFEAANWHPLTWISHQLDCELFQLDPAGPHITNVIFHALNALLLFWLLVKATGYLGRSFMVAALFALHPINVESVAWIAERKNVLSMFFFLLALAAYGWYARKPRVGPYLAVAFLFAMALMAKPQVITFPCVLLLWDYWPLQRMFANWPQESTGTVGKTACPARSLRWLLVEKIPFFALSAGSAAMTFIAQFGGGAQTWYPKPIRVGNAILSYGRYLGKTVWPAHLAVLYPHPATALNWTHVAVAFVALMAITALVAFNLRRRRYLVVGWLWFFGTLVPMIGIVQVGIQAMADRYAYLPLLGVFIMTCWGVADLAAKRHVPSRWLAAASVVALLALSLATHRQLNYWADNVTLWTHVLAVTDANFTAEDNLGGALMEQGKMEKAMPHYYRAAAINPLDSTSNLNIGAYEQHNGNLVKAIEQYQNVLANMRPQPKQKVLLYTNLGYAYRDMGDYADSRKNLETAVKLNPDDVGAWVFLGVAAQKTGDLDRAIQAYTRAMQIQSLDWAYLLLANALQQSGHTEEAQAAIRQARLVSRDFGQAQRTSERILAH